MAPDTGFPILGFCQKVGFHDKHVWFVIAVSNAETPVLAKLLAIMLLDEAEPVLHTMFMPDHPPTGFLDSAGRIRQGRGFFFAPWAEAEIQRIADVLEAKHRQYLRELAAALRQRPSAIFRPLEPGFFFEDPVGSERLGPVPSSIEVDVRNSERVRHGWTWDQVAAQDYARNRYLLLLSDEDLARRVEHIMANIHVVDDAGLVSFNRDDARAWYSLRLLNDVKVEIALRHGPYPAGWHPAMIDFQRMPGSLHRTELGVARRLQPVVAPEVPYLVKYGERKYMELMLHEGRVRLTPASRYSDPSLNNALRDDELTAVIDHDPFVPFNFAPPGTVLLPAGRVTTTFKAQSDYYPYCLSDQLAVRLLLDFGAQVCVLIHDPDAFLDRLIDAARRALPGWRSVARYVEYYDPLLVQPTQIEFPFWKHFRHAYQREFRIAWLPPAVRDSLSYVDISLGPLSDIAELVVPESPGQ